MSKDFEKISEMEMDRELHRLMKHKVEDRYTIADMAYLTGWTENYLRILEDEGRIPKAMRDDVIRGYGKKSKKGRRHWDEAGARAILFFSLAQKAKAG